jgi:asparagine synthetase B (glutamine-hydrolysing)
MCSFLLTNKSINGELTHINHFMQLRGPDSTNTVHAHGLTFVHNLLSITGEFTPQPFVSSHDQIYCIYNGQIYNYAEFGEYASDGQCLIPLYQKYGEEFVRKLDGEFALVLVDMVRDRMIVSSDVFATKPCWIAIESDKFAVASYASALTRMGFASPVKIPPNTTHVYALSELRLMATSTVFSFDLRQHKNTYNDWVRAFSASIEKRTRHLREKPFLCLSSGYDSGAIACEMKNQGVPFKAYTIQSHEDVSVLKARYKLHPNHELMGMSLWSYVQGQMEVQTCGDTFVYKGYDYKMDQAAAGLSHIFRHARSEGYKINFSGHGADEIISDYGMGGKKIYDSVSQFGGVFPEQLEPVFPYQNFFDGTMIQYLNKEEYVGGAYGIETRYPFLDTQLVQEFLWLAASLKNACYKAPIEHYLASHQYPFDANRKVGFYAGSDLSHPIPTWDQFREVGRSSRMTMTQKCNLPFRVLAESIWHALRK